MKTEPLLSSTFQPMMVISHIWRTQSKLFKMPASGPPRGARSLGHCPHLIAQGTEGAGTNTLCRSAPGQALGRDVKGRIEILGPPKVVPIVAEEGPQTEEFKLLLSKLYG